MRKAENILVLTHWSYNDPLIQAYTLPYVRIIRKNVTLESKVILVTFEQDHLKLKKSERIEAIDRNRKEAIELQLLTYFKLNLLAPFKVILLFSKLLYLIYSRRIHTIHAWCMPAGAMGYILSLLTGRRLIIDSYEPQAEAMVENRTWKEGSFNFHLLFYFEKKLSHHASIIISATEGMKEYAKVKYGMRKTSFHVKPACVDLQLFNPKQRKNVKLLEETGLKGKIVCVYAGKFGGIYLTSEVFDFFAQAQKFWGDQFRVLLLTNHTLSDLNLWANQAGFNPENMVVRFIPHQSIPDYLGLGDFGITPVKSIPTKRYCSPIKDGEYWAMGLPVVITKDISDDSDIIEAKEIGYVLKSFSADEYKKCISRINQLMTDKNTEARIRNIAIQYRSYDIAEKIYSEIYR